jgi:quercetin dioxygenase-like cupin family protein
MMGRVDEIQVVAMQDGPALAIVEGEGTAHAVIWPGIGAQLRSIHRIELARGASTIRLRHPSEAVYYVIEGSGETVDVDAAETKALRPGSMVHVDPGTTYVLSAGEQGLSLVGGPSPPDPALYEGAS